MEPLTLHVEGLMEVFDSISRSLSRGRAQNWARGRDRSPKAAGVTAGEPHTRNTQHRRGGAQTPLWELGEVCAFTVSSKQPRPRPRQGVPPWAGSVRHRPREVGG